MTNRHLGPQFNGAPCLDCRKDTIHDLNEYYHVHDDVWKQSGVEPRGGFLCIGCLEKRIGRQLDYKDFGDAPINAYPASDRLSQRRGIWSNSRRNMLFHSDSHASGGSIDSVYDQKAITNEDLEKNAQEQREWEAERQKGIKASEEREKWFKEKGLK